MHFNRLRPGIICLALLTLAATLGSLTLNAQTYTEGSIAGTVFDPSGAVVQGATIAIQNGSTNAEVSLTSDASGYFKAPQLPAAVYTLTVNATGFSQFREVNVIVQVGQTTEVPAHLSAGGATTTVEVTGEAPIMNFESPDISTVLTTASLEKSATERRPVVGYDSLDASCCGGLERLRSDCFSRHQPNFEQC